MTRSVPHFCRLWAWRSCDFQTGISTGIFVVCANKLTLPFNAGCKVLSVTSGDSSPKGRAKGVCNYIGNGAYRYRYAPLTVLRTPAQRQVFSVAFTNHMLVGTVINRPRGTRYRIRPNPMRIRTMYCRADTIRPYNTYP